MKDLFPHAPSFSMRIKQVQSCLFHLFKRPPKNLFRCHMVMVKDTIQHTGGKIARLEGPVVLLSHACGYHILDPGSLFPSSLFFFCLPVQRYPVSHPLHRMIALVRLGFSHSCRSLRRGIGAHVCFCPATKASPLRSLLV